MRKIAQLEKRGSVWFLIFAFFFFFLLRLPSLFEPHWYGDEGIYQVIGTSLNNGKLLYTEIFDNKPPLLYLLYAIFQSDQFNIRLASLVFGTLSVLTFFLLARNLFHSEKKNNIPLVATSVFAVFFGLPTFEGNIANAENFMLLPIIVAALLLLNFKKQISYRPPINPYTLAGTLLGIAFLFKIVAIFDLAAFLAFCLIFNFGSFKKLTNLLSILVGFVLPILITSLFFLSSNTFVDFIKAAFLTNISYVSYGNTIGGTPTLLFAKIVLLGIFILCLFTKRKMLSRTALFILIWFAFSLFNALFSQRPYTHYLLVLLPSFSLMLGLVLFDKKYQRAIAIFLVTSLITMFNVFGLPNFTKTLRYYPNFISYINGDKSTADYQEFFDRNTPFDYEIARFIKPKMEKTDTIFVWGNNAQLYQLVNVVAPTKYIVAYHISNYKDGVDSTKIGLGKTKPKFIVVMPNQQPIPFPLINYSRKMNINNIGIYERIF